MHAKTSRKGSKKAKTVVLGEDITLSHILEARASITDALNAAEEVVVNAGCVNAADLASLQLICAAHKRADGLGKKFTVEGMTQVLRDAAQDAGFLRAAPCSQVHHSDCLWHEGGRE